MKPFEETLATASDEWVGAGVITAAQREAILFRHPVSAATSSSHRFLGVLAGIGGALFVVGISLVIKSNWELIGDWVKIGGLVGLLAGTHALGDRLKISPGHYPKLGDASLMVAAVLFLLGIALVSQIFHIDSRHPNGVLLWCVGIVAVPWLMRAKGAQWVSVIAGLTWQTRIDYGIERYFVVEGKGSLRFKLFEVEASVSPAHRLYIKRVLLDGKACR